MFDHSFKRWTRLGRRNPWCRVTLRVRGVCSIYKTVCLLSTKSDCYQPGTTHSAAPSSNRDGPGQRTGTESMRKVAFKSILLLHERREKGGVLPQLEKLKNIAIIQHKCQLECQCSLAS